MAYASHSAHTIVYEETGNTPTQPIPTLPEQEHQPSPSRLIIYLMNPPPFTIGLKLIEMISIMQQDEFYLNQWVFMFDYFGMNVELLDKNQ